MVFNALTSVASGPGFDPGWGETVYHLSNWGAYWGALVQGGATMQIKYFTDIDFTLQWLCHDFTWSLVLKSISLKG